MASFTATHPSSVIDPAQISASIQNIRTGTVHQIVGGKLVMVYYHHPIIPSVIEDHWAAMCNPSRAFRRYIVSMDDGLALLAPDPVAAEEQSVAPVKPPVVNHWYLEKFGAQRYYEQEVPKPAHQQGSKKQEVPKPASPQARVPQRNARIQASAAQQPLTLPPGAIQAYPKDQEVLKPAPFPVPFAAQGHDFDQYQSARSMQAEAYRQYLKQQALKSAPFSFSALIAAQQQVPFQSAHSMQTEAYPDLAYGQLFEQTAPQVFAQEQEVLKPAPFQSAHSMQTEAYPDPAHGQLFEQTAPQVFAQEQEVLKPAPLQVLVNDQIPEGGMEYNVAHPPLPTSGFGDFNAPSENQWTPVTLESPEQVLIDLTGEEEEKEQVLVDLPELATEDGWVIINPTQEMVDEARRAENKKLTERKKELSRVLYSGAARRWYNSFIAAPSSYQRAYCNQYWGSNQQALDDVKEVIQYFDDFNSTRLHRLFHEAMINDPPLVSDNNGGERPMTSGEILQAINKDLLDLRDLKCQTVMSRVEPTTRKRKCSQVANETQPEKPAKRLKKQKKASSLEELPTPPPENSDADAPGEDDDEPAALTADNDRALEEWKAQNPGWADEESDEDEDESEDPASLTADNDRALEEWKRLNPNWAVEDPDEDEEEEEEDGM
jgi:hypothetical protein